MKVILHTRYGEKIEGEIDSLLKLLDNPESDFNLKLHKANTRALVRRDSVYFIEYEEKK